MVFKITTLARFDRYGMVKLRTNQFSSVNLLFSLQTTLFTLVKVKRIVILSLVYPNPVLPLLVVVGLLVPIQSDEVLRVRSTCPPFYLDGRSFLQGH